MKDVRSRKIEAVFFDFEGTLVNFQWQLDTAVAETLAALSGLGYSKDLYGKNPGYAHIYNHTLLLFSQKAANDNALSPQSVMDAIYDRYDQDALTRWQLYPETITVIEHLRKKECKLALISNVGLSALTAAIEKIDIGHFFDTVVSRNEMPFLKPHPEGLLIAARNVGLSPSVILFVGDSLNDISAAHAAGMHACYLIGGENKPEELGAASPDFTLTSLSQLPQLLYAEGMRCL